MTKKHFLSKALMLLLLAVFSFSLYSCKDSDEDIITYYDTYIEGYIKDFHTGEPVAGVVFDADYFDDANGSFGTDPFKVKDIAVSNSQGYYKIKVPKHGELGSRTMSVDFNGLRVFPRATEDYSFEFGTFVYKTDSVNIISKRIDISSITYGYLKVVMPIDYNESWAINSWEASSYEKPFYKGKLVDRQVNNADYKLLLFKVPLEKTRFSYGENLIHDFEFTISHPKDTAIINIVK